MKTQKTRENQAVSPFSSPGGTDNRFCKSHSCQPRTPTVKYTSFRLHYDEILCEHSLRCIFLFREAVSVLSAKPFCRKLECLAVNPNESSSLQWIKPNTNYTLFVPLLFLFALFKNVWIIGIPELLPSFTLFFVLHGPNQNYWGYSQTINGPWLSI